MYWQHSKDTPSYHHPNQGRKEVNDLFNDALNIFYFTVIWRRTYGKGPLR